MTGVCRPQVDQFTIKSLGAVPRGSLGPPETGTHDVLAVDIGGSKLIAALYEAGNDCVRRAGDVLRVEALHGRGYLGALVTLAAQARRLGLRVGISYAGAVADGRARSGLNLGTFMDEFERAYQLDFRKIFDRTAVLNDGEAGVVAAAEHARRAYRDVSNVVLVVNGSGLNAAAVVGGRVHTMEAGHVRLLDPLNPFGQKKICPLSAPPHVCVEHVASSRSGIEDLWCRLTGNDTRGPAIAEALSRGDQLAVALYQSSAVVTAHVVLGVFNAFGLTGEWGRSIVVYHGGTFAVPGFADRMAPVIAEGLDGTPRFVTASEFSGNLCLDGAAYAALAL